MPDDAWMQPLLIMEASMWRGWSGAVMRKIQPASRDVIVGRLTAAHPVFHRSLDATGAAERSSPMWRLKILGIHQTSLPMLWCWGDAEVASACLCCHSIYCQRVGNERVNRWRFLYNSTLERWDQAASEALKTFGLSASYSLGRGKDSREKSFLGFK